MRPDTSVAHGQIKVKRVSIEDVVGSTEVMVRDGSGWKAQIRSDLRPKGTGAPAKGEIWMIEKVGPIWKLTAMVGVPARPVITGDRAGSGVLTATVLDALSGQGLIDDRTTGTSGTGEGIPGPPGADSTVPGPPGDPGAPGAPGAPGDPGAVSFVFTQVALSDTWEIYHTLPYVPSVMVVDTAGTTITGEIEYVAPGHLRCLFSLPTSGTAYLS